MSATLSQVSSRSALHARIDRLRPGNPARWGTMTAAGMVCHVTDHLRMALGDLAIEPAPLEVWIRGRRLPLGRGMLWLRPVRTLMVHWLPWPKGWVGAPPETLRTTPGEWADGVGRLHEMIERTAGKDPADTWGAHPVFGRLSGREWGRICWKHLDYHLRQFGV